MNVPRRFATVLASCLVVGSLTGAASAHNIIDTIIAWGVGSSYGHGCGLAYPNLEKCQSCSDHRCGDHYGYGTPLYYSCQAGSTLKCPSAEIPGGLDPLNPI